MSSGEGLFRENRSGKIRKTLSDDVAARLLESLHSNKRVQGLTHQFYRYPARFSPEFARSVIDTFSNPGETVLDPFMGGGTTIVEGLTLGRKVVGIDVNSLAVLIARVKSTPLSLSELSYIRRLINEIYNWPPRSNGIKPDATQGILFKNVPWWTRNCILTILEKIKKIENKKVHVFLRCGLLRTAQWALDCREIIPTSRQFLHAFCANTLEMCDQMDEYRAALRSAGIFPNEHISRFRRLLLRSALDIDRDGRIPSDWLPIKLVVTSPPYPGVHVLYHRWQIRGRRETPAPFGILNSLDGHFPSYYTFGDRRRVERYFEILTGVYRSIAKLLAPSSLVVQLLSFANPRNDVGHFLEAMDHAGFDDCSLKDVGLGITDRIWRLVPHRKWYAGYRDGSHAGKELLLFHRLKRT